MGKEEKSRTEDRQEYQQGAVVVEMFIKSWGVGLGSKPLVC
jgi:hypothetical protein